MLSSASAAFSVRSGGAVKPTLSSGFRNETYRSDVRPEVVKPMMNYGPRNDGSRFGNTSSFRRKDKPYCTHLLPFPNLSTPLDSPVRPTHHHQTYPIPNPISPSSSDGLDHSFDTHVPELPTDVTSVSPLINDVRNPFDSLHPSSQKLESIHGDYGRYVKTIKCLYWLDLSSSEICLWQDFSI
ncbi:unnamed protein product [Fraxinus pennsylvanica]|uniref:Uncharacterized protein n=1 Tax=Fraxinus pennsylvanica TaxID=56036 RepID=A0AAD2AEP5_9LAMI|nr:unnamed protein product [Fraxinus pennsylvanica]